MSANGPAVRARYLLIVDHELLGLFRNSLAAVAAALGFD